MNPQEKFIVEPGEEIWDYDVPDGMPPTKDIMKYWVTFKGKKIREFYTEESAINYAEKLNQV